MAYGEYRDWLERYMALRGQQEGEGRAVLGPWQHSGQDQDPLFSPAYPGGQEAMAEAALNAERGA